MSSSDKWDDDGYVLAWYITYLPLVALLFAIERLYVRSLPDSPWWALVWILAIPFAFEAVFEKTSEKLIYKVDKCLSGLTMPQFRKATLSIVFSIGFFCSSTLHTVTRILKTTINMISFGHLQTDLK